MQMQAQVLLPHAEWQAGQCFLLPGRDIRFYVLDLENLLAFCLPNNASCHVMQLLWDHPAKAPSASRIAAVKVGDSSDETLPTSPSGKFSPTCGR